MSTAVLTTACETKPCSKIESWDECEKASHCSPAHFIVHEEHEGPVWECADKDE